MKIKTTEKSLKKWKGKIKKASEEDLLQLRFNSWRFIGESKMGEWSVDISNLCCVDTVVEAWLRIDFSKEGQNKWTSLFHDGYGKAHCLYKLIKFNENNEHNLRKLFVVDDYGHVLGGFDPFVNRKSWFPNTVIEKKMYGKIKQLYEIRG